MLTVTLAQTAWAQSLPKDAIRYSAAVVKSSNGGFALLVEMKIKPPYHVNANPASEEYLIPTSITLKADKSVKPAQITYPKPQMVSFAFTGSKKIAVYTGTQLIQVPVSIVGEPKSNAIHISLQYQACDDQSCYAPQTVQMSAVIPASLLSTASGSSAPTPEPTPATGDRLTDLLSSRRMGVAIPLIFLLGLLLNLTPCVYPIIPITIAFFAKQSADSLSKQLSLSAVYVLGMAIMYASLGTAAAILGKTFGFQLQNPWVVGGFALILVLLALSMFGLYEIQMPASWRNQSKLRGGYLGAFLMGLLVGIAAAPCVGPVVVALATAVSTSGSIGLGFGLFFTLGLGLGAPYLVLGAFSSQLKSLPRSGAWMIAVERVFGLLLLCTAVYLVQPILPDHWHWTFAAVIALSGIYLNLFDKNAAQLRGFSLFKKALGLTAVAAAVWMLKPAPESQADLPNLWQPYTPTAYEQSISAHKPVVLDFYADWCIPCKELDEQTFSDPQIRQLLSKTTALKVNLTTDSNAFARELKAKYSVKGVPTVIFIDGQGAERQNLRLTGFEPANKFIQRIQQITK